jgi:DNA primase
VDIVGRYLDLKPAGAGRFKALCPFHREKTPSFHVIRDRQIFHCFGCGKGGDVLTFVQEIDGVTFREALVQLADRAGIQLASFSGQHATDSDERPELFRAMSFAAKHFQGELATQGRGDTAREYLASRETPESLIDRFGIGFAPEAWDRLTGAARRGGVNERVLEAAGLAKRGPNGLYDRFRNRVMFPIRDVSGKVVAFGGRTLGDDSAKYINSPESPVYRKGRVLYGLFEARDAMRASGEALLVEGYFDLLRCFEAGLENVVAPCGTALTEEQARTVRRYANSIVVVFDSDEAGIRAALRSVGILAAAGLTVRALALPGGNDPDDFIRAHGAGAFQSLVREAPGFVPFYVRMSGERTGSIEGRTAVAAELFEVIRGLNDPLRQDEYVKLVAGELGLDEFRCRASFRDHVEGRRNRAELEQEPRPSNDVNAHDREFVSILLESPERAVEVWGSLVNIQPEHSAAIEVLRVLAECPGLDPLQALENEAARLLYSAAAAAPNTWGGRGEAIVRERVVRFKRDALLGERARLQEAIRRAQQRKDDAQLTQLTIEKIGLDRRIEQVGAA